MSEGRRRGADALEDAHKYCAAVARKHVRDQWLGALYANPGARGALFALASFDHEIGRAAARARDPNSGGDKAFLVARRRSRRT